MLMTGQAGQLRGRPGSPDRGARRRDDRRRDRPALDRRQRQGHARRVAPGRRARRVPWAEHDEDVLRAGAASRPRCLRTRRSRARTAPTTSSCLRPARRTSRSRRPTGRRACPRRPVEVPDADTLRGRLHLLRRVHRGRRGRQGHGAADSRRGRRGRARRRQLAAEPLLLGRPRHRTGTFPPGGGPGRVPRHGARGQPTGARA